MYYVYSEYGYECKTDSYYWAVRMAIHCEGWVEKWYNDYGWYIIYDTWYEY